MSNYHEAPSTEPESGLEVHNPSGLEHAPSTTYAETGYSGYQSVKPEESVIHNEEPIDRRNTHTVPWGLSAWAFAALVSLITAIIVGAAVGGGVGAHLASVENSNKHSSSTSASSATISAPTTATTTRASLASLSSTSTTSSTTATATTLKTDYVVTPATDISTLELDCPNLNGEGYMTVRGQNYTIHCGTGLTGDDLVSILAYTLPDCIEACSGYNYFNYYYGDGNPSKCQAAAFTGEIQTNYADQHANCWLKNGTTITGTNFANVASANLNT